MTIVTTYYNRAGFLKETLRSLQLQTMTDWEAILWNDGSTDNSEEIAREMAEMDSRFRIFGGERIGHAQSLVRSCAEAQGRYIGVLDSDDLLEPTALEEAAAVLESRPEIGMVYTDHVVIDGNGQRRGLGRRCQIPFSKDRMLLDFMTFHFRLIRMKVPIISRRSRHSTRARPTAAPRTSPPRSAAEGSVADALARQGERLRHSQGSGWTGAACADPCEERARASRCRDEPD